MGCFFLWVAYGGLCVKHCSWTRVQKTGVFFAPNAHLRSVIVHEQHFTRARCGDIFAGGVGAAAPVLLLPPFLKG